MKKLKQDSKPATPSVNTVDQSIRILKIATCSSLSGRSTLSYHIAVKGDQLGKTDLISEPEVLFRIYTNTGRGFFSKEWIPTNAIQKVFQNHDADAALSSSFLNPIFKGKSINTAGFLLAVLKAEGLIVNMKERKRYYQRVNADAFASEVKSLMASSISLNPDDKPVLLGKVAKKSIQTAKTSKQ